MNPSIATVGANGVVTGHSEGTAYFEFTDNVTGCKSDGSLSIEVQASPEITITGSSTICLGYTTTLSPAIAGIWTSSNPAVATVSNTGVVTGHAPGIVTFEFMDPVTGCTSLGVSDPVTIENCINSWAFLGPLLDFLLLFLECLFSLSLGIHELLLMTLDVGVEPINVIGVKLALRALVQVLFLLDSGLSSILGLHFALL